MTSSFKSAGIFASALALAMLAAPAEAQFGGLLGGSRNRDRDKEDSEKDNCTEQKRSTGSRVAGGILGSIAGTVAGNVGGGVGNVLTYVPVAALTDTLTASIACKLNPDEQHQAANATAEATRGADDVTAPAVGQMSEWTSITRDDVSGTSTVTESGEVDENGLQCIMVSDVIIVRGEETRAQKRMCRRPPAARYSIAA